MEIRALSPMNGEDLDLEDLLSYLSQVVLSKIDTEIERESKELVQSRTRLSEAKTSLTTVKDKLTTLVQEYRRYSVMFEALRKIDALRKEGVWVGPNKGKIKKILNEIGAVSISKLRSLEEKLSTYVPEAPKITFG